MLDRLREQLAVVGELTVDQARGEHDVAELEDDLVLSDADGERVVLGLLRDPRQLLQGAGRHVRLEAALQRRLERGLLDAQPVGVGRDHPQLLAGGRHQDAGEDGAGLVARGRARDARRSSARTPRAGSAIARLRRGLGQRREVLGAQRAQMERGAAPRSARRPARRRAARASTDRPAASARHRAAGGRAARRCRGSAPPRRGERAGRSPCRWRAAPAGIRSLAEIITPESACTALRVEATRVTVCSWFDSSAAERDSFMTIHLLERIGSSRGCEVVCSAHGLENSRYRLWAGWGQISGSLSGGSVGVSAGAAELAAELAAQLLHSLA